MDCRSFRKQHFAYLDDTLSGDDTSLAQDHLRDCDPCRAHDTLVRRSLMMARSLPPIEPSAEFQEKLRASLEACREEREKKLARAAARPASRPASRPATRKAPNTSHTVAAVGAGMLIGALAWSGLTSFGKPTTVAMQPTTATEPALASQHPYITPALMQAMSTGNPVWPAAVLIEDVPTYFVTADFNLAEAR